MHLVYLQEFCITIVFNISREEKSKTLVGGGEGGVNKVHYGVCENGEFKDTDKAFLATTFVSDQL